MSNYMTYLLFDNPEMLLPGTRRNLFTTAYDELKDILRDNEPATEKEEGLLMQRVISTMQDNWTSQRNLLKRSRKEVLKKNQLEVLKTVSSTMPGLLPKGYWTWVTTTRCGK